VEGSAAALILTIASRSAALGDLTGDGAQLLAATPASRR
jgi:hypothetical protein